MQISQVTEQDGRLCAQLINMLKSGRWDLSGADADAFVATKKWVQSLAMQMAEQLKSNSPEKPDSSPTGGFKITKMGQLPTSPAKTSNTKKLNSSNKKK